MKRERKKLYPAAAVVLCVVFFSFLSVHIVKLDGEIPLNPENQEFPPVKITDEWMYRYGDSPADADGRFLWLDDGGGWSSFKFPGRPHNPDGQRSIWIKGRLPEGNWTDPTLRFRAPQQALEIYLDGNRIYRFGKIDLQNKTKTPGSILHLVSLPPEFQGREIYFRLYSPLPSYTGYLVEIGIPDEILNKPGKLTRNESEKMKQHAKIGCNIANRSKELVNIAPLILHHHERWDGKGYPDGLRTLEIPLECRILGIIDAYDAMTNERPYHKGVGMEEALAEIAKCSETYFDPEIASRFIEAVRKISAIGASPDHSRI